VKNTVGKLNTINKNAYLCIILDANLIIGFLCAAKFVKIEAIINALCIKNITLKLLAKSSTKPIDATLTDVTPPN
jgi:hypothetical protein